MIISTTFGFVGSLVLSRSNSIGMALAGIALTGVSYGAQPLALAVPSEVLPRKYRSYAQAGANIAASIGLISTLYIGGALMRNGHHAGFRILAYIMAGIYAFSTIVVFLLYNPPPRKLQVELTLAEKLRRLDWIGYILLTTGLVVFCLGLSWAKNPYPWNDARVLAPFLIGVALTACFVVYEWRLKSDGMLHHGLFRHRNFPLAMVCIFGEGIVFFCANNYISFRASVYYTTDPLRLGLNYSIIFWTAIIVSLVAGWVISRTKTLREVLCLSFVMFLTFWILMATCTPETPEANIWGYPVILGIGLALCLVTVVTTGQLAVSAELISLSSGLMVAMRSLGGSVGIAIYNAIFNSIFENDLAPKIAGAVLPLGLPQSSLGPLIQALTAQNEAALAQVPGANQGIIHAAALALLDVYSVAFRYVFVAAGALSLIGLIGKSITSLESGFDDFHIGMTEFTDKIFS